VPTLNWIGKEAVVNHHLHVPFHLLKDVPELACGDPGSGNLIVQGDNLVALKALLPYYAGQVKCICVDPPYNTGEQLWTYNDKVNSPLIADWLGRTVGREVDDLCRHDKWLCMMYPRLQLLLKFLRRDGFLLICIDDVELYRLKLVMDELLPPDRFVGTFVWKSRRNLDSRHKVNVSTDHEYVLAYRGPDAVLRGANFRHDVEAVDQHGGIVEMAQGGMENGAIFGRVDFFSGEHARAPIRDFLLFGQREQEGERFVRYILKGVIEAQAAERKVVFLNPRGIAEKIAEAFGANRVAMTN